MIGRLLRRLRGAPTCAEIMEQLQGYLDGEVNAEEARRVATHLDACGACDEESQVYRDIKAALAARRREIDPEVRAALETFGRNLSLDGTEPA